ncbi:MAG: ribonuclease P protein component [Chitinophagales bacterium]
MGKRFTLGKNERLKSRKLIEQLFHSGKRFSVSSYRVFYLMNKIPGNQKIKFTIQFGVGVSGKSFKKAVDRNRIKRLIRESYRLQKNELQKILTEKKLQLNIFFIYTHGELPDFNTTKIKVNVALEKILQVVKEMKIS